MAVLTPQTRPPKAFQIHRDLKAPRTTRLTTPSGDISETEKFQTTPVAPVPSANTGKTSKFTAKSPLVTTMGSSKVK